MSETLKVRSFRVADETADKFRKIAEELGSANQDETFARLIRAYEMQKGKELLPERAEDISRFELYADLLTKLYMTALEEGACAKELAMSEIGEKIKDRDEIIIKLQKTLSETEKTATVAEEHLLSLKEQAQTLESNMQQQKKDYTAIKEERDKLKDRITALEKEISRVNDEKYMHQRDVLTYKAEAEALKKTLSEVQEQLKDNISILREKERVIANQKNALHDTESSLKEAYEKGRKEGAAEEKEQFLKQSEQYLLTARHAEEKYLSAMEQIEELHKRYITLLEKQS